MLPADSYLDGFAIRRPIATGATSTVYEARDAQGRLVALKVFHRELQDRLDLLGRFLSEARLILRQQLAHPGLPEVYAVQLASSGLTYIVMELLGPALTLELRQGPLPPQCALNITAQLAEVLAYLHQRHILHRDVKPANVVRVLALADSPPAASSLFPVKLIDLGQAKLGEGAQRLVSTGLNDRCGTPAYRAPEQWLSAKTVSDRTDVYSLGVLLFELLTGRLPFADRDEGTLRLAHAMDDPPVLPAGAAVQALYAAMLDKDPAQRPGAAAVANALRALLRG